MDDIAKLTSKKRRELFFESARKIGVKEAIVEKDFWVVWVLDKIFSDSRLKNILVFKGGTSLSKVFGLIGRFSEDIDLILDWDLVTTANPFENRSKNQQDKFNKKINKSAIEFIQHKLLPIFKELLESLCKCRFVIDDKKNYFINIAYPASFKDSYLRAEILLEIAPLASWMPCNEFEITSYAHNSFPTLFTKRSTKVKAILAKRTFWEKATILHNETFRPTEKTMPIRYSRHYYDLAIMSKNSIKKEAFEDINLLFEVVEFKKKFYPDRWSDYDSIKEANFKLLPTIHREKELRKDYKNMEHMIFDKYLSFDEILEILNDLEVATNKAIRNYKCQI